HSIFNETPVDDSLLNSSRSLRKRKTLSAEAEEHTPVLRKRSRQTSLLRSERAVSRDQGLGGTELPGETGTDRLSPARMRPRRRRTTEKERCRVVSKQLGKQLVVGFTLPGNKLSKILNSRQPSRPRNRRTPKPPSAVQEPQAHFAPITPASYISP